MKNEKAERRKRRKAIMAEIAQVEAAAMNGGKLDEKRLRELGEELNWNAFDKKDEFYPERQDGEKLTGHYYRIAKENGIGVNTLKDRFYNHNWSAEKAATKPVNRRSKVEDSGITKEIYLHEKKNFVKDVEIAENFNISMTALERFKRNEGVTRKMRKQRGEL